LPVILITAHASVDSAVSALKVGATDFIEKPINIPYLKKMIMRALGPNKVSIYQKRARNKDITFIGESEASEKIRKQIHIVAGSDASVLILGESGTGKEVVAKCIHEESKRSGGPFIAINCSSIPENLLEAELFGYEKGAFTGADRSKSGLFEEADGGTIFLDEIGDMPKTLQAKLLRVLQEREVRRVGGVKTQYIDVRILSATHQNLRELVGKGEFREDLYYRLNVFPIHIDPLRDKKEDVIILANRMLESFGRRYEKKISGFSQSAIEGLMKHSWPGNVRELQNVVERAIMMCTDKEIRLCDLMLESPILDRTHGEGDINFPKNLPLRDLENLYIKHVLEIAKYNKDTAATILGINRKTLYRREKEITDQIH